MKRHRLDVVSLLFGILFVGFAVTAVFADEDITALEARWVWPVLLVVVGLAVVGFSLGRDRRRRRDEGEASGPADHPQR